MLALFSLSVVKSTILSDSSFGARGMAPVVDR